MKKPVIRQAWVQILPPVFCGGCHHFELHCPISERRIALPWKGTCNDAQEAWNNRSGELPEHLLSLQQRVLCSFNTKTELDH